MATERNIRCYVLVPSQTDAWALYEACKNGGVGARIAPTPRKADAHASCGTSLLVDCADGQAALEVARRCGIATEGVVEVENAIDPTRDRYC